ncbi:hypothetical protein SKAU_G00383610 [Synaphobranchus kaupii]|uniref:PLA2c domain-containing protein n=1 Tax=Synaphobranchus kaupii TaxID=118154 RepID=A0A9Q1IEZ9_SYNKA|nr:hypothetical protein SKAU_G00383610 [Synaphobranchus kaupii]
MDDMATKVVESILELFDCEDDEESAKHLQKIHEIMSVIKSENDNTARKSMVGKSKEEKYECLAEIALDAYREFKGVFHTLSAEVPEEVLSDEHTHLEDAGPVMDSPYVAALRPDRKVKLILSFDFSVGDPFMTVIQAAKYCKDTGIPFPPVDIPEEDKEQPKDFYVFKSENTPTVIHIPLFNMVNCKGDVAKWRQRYPTFKLGYNREMMDELIRVSGLNVANNKNRILQEISEASK